MPPWRHDNTTKSALHYSTQNRIRNTTLYMQHVPDRTQGMVAIAQVACVVIIRTAFAG